jgi:hypothetical protein
LWIRACLLYHIELAAVGSRDVQGRVNVEGGAQVQEYQKTEGVSGKREEDGMKNSRMAVPRQRKTHEALFITALVGEKKFWYSN